MPIRVDFYLLQDPQPEGRYPILYRLLYKAYQRNHTVYIHASSALAAQQLDELLWLQQEDGFLPHGLCFEQFSLMPPIQIGYDLTRPPPGQHQILVNFTAEFPQFYPQFQRVIELVPADAVCRAQARSHYKLYKDQGCALESHQL